MTPPSAPLHDPRLTHPALAPIPPPLRTLKGGYLVLAIAMLVVSPATYAFTAVNLPVRTSLLALSLGMLLVGAILSVLAKPARHHGLGFVLLTRAIFGHRGAMPVLALRWLCGVTWMAFWAHDIGNWITLLLRKLLDTPPLVIGPSTNAAFAVDLAIIVTLVVVGAWYLASLGLTRVLHIAAIFAGIAAVLTAALLVLAGNVSHGFGAAIAREPNWGSIEFGTATIGAVGLLVPWLLSSSDIWRFVQGATVSKKSARATIKRRRVSKENTNTKTKTKTQTKAKIRTASTPGTPVFFALLGLVPAAVAIAVCGALMASASEAILGTSDFSPIPDAAGFGGLAGAGLALVVVLMAWLGAAALLGFHISALALCGIWPRMDYRSALLATLGATLAFATVWSPLTTVFHVSWPAIAALAAAPLGIMLADDVVWRRGRVAPEDTLAYARGSGGLLGARPSAVVALFCGWLVQPWVLRLLPLPQSFEQLTTWSGHQAVLLAVSGLLAAFVFLLIAPIEYVLLMDGAPTTSKRHTLRGSRKTRPNPRWTDKVAAVPTDDDITTP